MRPSSPSSPTELELAKLEKEMNNFDETVLIPLQTSLDKVTVDLASLVPELLHALGNGTTGDIKKALNNLPPELKILFKNLTGDLQLDDYFITKFMRTDDDSEMFLALEKNYGTIFNNSD